jgi:hypothetical protein
MAKNNQDLIAEFCTLAGCTIFSQKLALVFQLLRKARDFGQQDKDQDTTSIGL